MIYGNLKYINEYSLLNDNILKCFEYARCNNLCEYEKGSYQINGNRLLVNIAEYETEDSKNRFWEAHKKYIDVHLILSGSERIDTAFVDDADLKKYSSDEDFQSLSAVAGASVILKKNDFLICFSHDCHMTSIAAGKPSNVKKAIFKVLIE